MHVINLYYLSISAVNASAHKTVHLWYISILPSNILSHTVCCCSMRCQSWPRYSDSCSFLGAFTQLWKHTKLSAFVMCLSVRPHVTPRLPLDAFSLNLISVYFSKICRENTCLIKSDMNNGYNTWIRTQIYDNFSLNWSENEKCFRQKL
jgi:hypothetical protein